MVEYKNEENKVEDYDPAASFNDYDYNEYIDYTNDYDMSEVNVNKLERELSYSILRPSDIDKLRTRIVEDFMEFTSLPKEEATIALIFFQWNIDKIKGAWYDNLEENRKKCGLEADDEARKELEMINKKRGGIKDSNLCRICEVSEIDKTAHALKCGHKFCSECWEGYIDYKMEDLMTCITATCPQKGCNIVVPETVFYKFLEDKPSLKEEYQKALFKNFTEYNSDIKWCPNPKCGLCVRVPGHYMKEIECECKQTFCFACGNEGHRPCDCQMILRWNEKNQSQSENVKWLKANTKQCPSCHKYIEKNQGCNHMTCRKEAGGCGYEFCWICLGEWKPHGSSYYQCNRFDKDKACSEEEMVKNAKYDIEKYIFYFDRYMNHQRSQELGNKLKTQIKSYIDQFRSEKLIPYEELLFLEDAVETIINSRRTLKYTYVFGYYMIKCNEKTLFEYNQFLLDRDTDRLHGMMEGETLKKILETETYEAFNKSFMEFKNNVVNLLSTINSYKEKLLSEIENKMIELIDFKAMENKSC